MYLDGTSGCMCILGVPEMHTSKRKVPDELFLNGTRCPPDSPAPDLRATVAVIPGPCSLLSRASDRGFRDPSRKQKGNTEKSKKKKGKMQEKQKAKHPTQIRSRSPSSPLVPSSSDEVPPWMLPQKQKSKQKFEVEEHICEGNCQHHRSSPTSLSMFKQSSKKRYKSAYLGTFVVKIQQHIALTHPQNKNWKKNRKA